MNNIEEITLEVLGTLICSPNEFKNSVLEPELFENQCQKCAANPLPVECKQRCR